jgi:hypothetical protein
MWFFLGAITANGLYRAGLEGFLAEFILVGASRLLIDVGVTGIVIPFKIIWGGLATEITVYTLAIHVKLSFRLISQFIVLIGHFTSVSFLIF